MSKFDGAPKIDAISLQSSEPNLGGNFENFSGSIEDAQDQLFDLYMKQQLETDFFDTLGGYLDEEDVVAAQEVFAEYSDKELYSTFSLPHELRDKKFTEFEKKIAEGEDVQELVKDFIAISSKHQFGVGYHTSPVDIRPDEQGTWIIKGTEPDHRDDDFMMAYYSSQYRHLFKMKNPKFIYIIRTEPQTHKTDGNWSRASSLSVVGRVPFEDVYSFVENTSKKIMTTPESEVVK